MQAGWPSGPGHPHSVAIAIIAMALFALCGSCGETYHASSGHGILTEGREERMSVAFAVNGRPVTLELLMRLEGTGATIELDHPDGRTTENIEISGPGIRELLKEFPKEPGSWGLRLVAKGGNAAYWVALHDRARYIGPDDAARLFVERH